MTQDTPMNGSAFGTSTGSDSGPAASGTNSGIGNSGGLGSDICPTCGASRSQDHSLEQFLGRLGISEEMVNNLKSSMRDVDVEEYLATAREYLRTEGTKASSYAKENPGKVAAGVAVLAVGAGLLISAINRE